MSEELRQKRFVDEEPEIINASESHMACVFLLDTSGSMSGDPITSLNRGINQFIEQTGKDEQTKSIVDLAIIEFNSTYRIVQKFAPIGTVKNISLSAGGGTNMEPAIQLAIDMIDERSRFYRRTGAEPYKPWVFMITDGEADVSNITHIVKQKEDADMLKLFSLGVEGYNSKTLHELCGNKVLKLKGIDFTEFFDWVHKSLRAVSVSSPGERIKAVDLPESVDKDTDELMN